MGPKNAKRSNRQLGKEIVGLQRAFPGTEHVGLALTRRGDVVAALDATDGGDPRVWIDDDAQVP